MARRRMRRRRQDEEAPGWVWMLCGLGLGLVVALGVYVSGARRPPASESSAMPAASLGSRTIPAPATDDAASRPAEPTATIEPPPETRFDFYELLPQFEVLIPEVESQVPVDRARATIEQPGRYVVQVGSFSALADADRRQAELALLGIESRIQRVTIDNDIFHRVRIGPVADLRELDRIRSRLRDERIDSLLMQLPD